MPQTINLAVGAAMTTLDQQIIEWFNSLWGGNGWGNIILIFISFLLTGLLSGVIGFEREYHGHAAGLRTHILVAMGSAIVMVISLYGFPNSFSDHRDPARLAAQVVSGIGFLGAGTIIQTGTDVKGLTTATTLWLAMAIGLACGSGNFLIATIGTAIAFVALVALRWLEKIASRRNPIVMIVVPSDRPVLKDVLLAASRFGINVRDTSSQLKVLNNVSVLRITLRCSYTSQASVTAFVDELRATVGPLELKVSTDN